MIGTTTYDTIRGCMDKKDHNKDSKKMLRKAVMKLVYKKTNAS
jgi:hypothetical protein